MNYLSKRHLIAGFLRARLSGDSPRRLRVFFSRRGGNPEIRDSLWAGIIWPHYTAPLCTCCMPGVLCVLPARSTKWQSVSHTAIKAARHHQFVIFDATSLNSRFANPCSVCVRMRIYLIRLRLHFTPCDRTCVKTALTAKKSARCKCYFNAELLGVEFCSRIREAPLYIHHARPTHTCKCTPEAIRHPAHFSKRI